MAVFSNHYAQLPERMFARVEPVHVPAPKLLAWNESLASELGLADITPDKDALAELFSGNCLPQGATPIAAAYAGHQFGHFVPQLGDGRAVLLGDVTDAAGRCFDVQLKGSGRTPFSRGGDGKSSLGPVIREYVLSEAMHALGVPTTRALAAIESGEQVQRESALPGGVLTRVASSHIRIGSFEYFAVRGDVEAVRALADFAISRHAPELADQPRPYVALFAEVVQRQAALVAHWMSVGFIHGVMNTDNMTVSGETLDYGPCAFLDEYNAGKVFSSIDHHGRYAYDKQAPIAHWNLTRLAECLLLLDDEQAVFIEHLERFKPLFDQHYHDRMADKLGLLPSDAVPMAEDAQLVQQWLDYLQQHALDFTQSFRELVVVADSLDAPRFGDFERQWRQRIARQPGGVAAAAAAMQAINPVYIPRNHQIERAIRDALQGNYDVFNELRVVLANPFDAQPEFAHYAQAPDAADRVTQTFCGT